MFDLLILLICFLFNDTWTESFFELNHLHLNVAMMDDGMDSDDDLLLTIEVVFRRKVYCPISVTVRLLTAYLIATIVVNKTVSGMW